MAILNGQEVELRMVVEGGGCEGEALALDDNAGNTLDMAADGTTIIDTAIASVLEGNATIGAKLALSSQSNTGVGIARGTTFSVKRRLNATDQDFTSYFLTSGMLEIRKGVTSQLDNSGSGVKTTFSSAMSGPPDIVLLQPKSGVTGIANPKVVSMDSSGFYATLGGSSGTNSTCYYLAIKFNYMPN